MSKILYAKKIGQVVLLLVVVLLSFSACGYLVHVPMQVNHDAKNQTEQHARVVKNTAASRYPTTPTPTSATSTPTGATTGWHEVFRDDFQGNQLNTSNWNTCYDWGCQGGNGEAEHYTPNGVSVSNGLSLTATKSNGQYYSGMVSSFGHFSYLYGYAEARFKIPSGQGLWPAFWMLGTGQQNKDELDAMEILGNQTNLLYMTVHHQTQLNSTSNTWTGPDFSTGYHTVGLDWEPNSLTWYVDGVVRSRITDPQYIPHTPMYVILDLAVGGDWPGYPNASTPFPSSFDIQYVSVQQKSGS